MPLEPDRLRKTIIAVDVANVASRLAFGTKEEITPVLVSSLFWGHVKAWETYFKPALLVFCCDREAGDPSFRKDWHHGYKSARVGNPNVAECLAVINREIPINATMPGRSFLKCSMGCEADDLVGLVTSRSLEAGFNVAILSNDKDLRQLLRGGRVTNIKGIKLKAGAVHSVEYVTAAGLQSELGIRPDQMLDYLCLVGDASDSIAGCPSIGEKTAVELLKAFATLDDAIAAPHFSISALTNRQESLLRSWAAHPTGLQLARKLISLYPPAIDWHPTVKESAPCC